VRMETQLECLRPGKLRLFYWAQVVNCAKTGTERFQMRVNVCGCELIASRRP
jgi:hypothetical protein